MNIITKAISEVKFSIPPEILNITFKERTNSINIAFSIDEMIMSRVLRPRVLVDANLVGGVTKLISVSKCEIFEASYSEFIINVPKTLTNNKSMVSVQSLELKNINTNPFSNYTSNSNTSPLTSRIELISDNTVIVMEPAILLSMAVIRCTVENNNNLTNISPRAYHKFAKLVVLAVKAYIYNEMVVKLDKGYIYSGHELSIIKDIIDGYGDANELYIEYLTTVWNKVAFMNDAVAVDSFYADIVSSMV